MLGAKQLGRPLLRVATWTACGLAFSVLAVGCDISTMEFRKDHRIHITAPRDQEEVRLPVAIRWTARRVDGDSFGVFVDGSPIKAGQSLRYLARHDPACLSRPDCPDAAWLSGRGIYVTKRTTLQLQSLADERPKSDLHGRDPHTVTIVLLRDGRRLNESSWSRQFYVIRGDS